METSNRSLWVNVILQALLQEMSAETGLEVVIFCRKKEWPIGMVDPRTWCPLVHSG